MAQAIPEPLVDYTGLNNQIKKMANYGAILPYLSVDQINELMESSSFTEFHHRTYNLALAAPTFFARLVGNRGVCIHLEFALELASIRETVAFTKTQ